MSHPKFGQRYTCFQCGAKFYDMLKEKPICPKCSANQRKAPKKASAIKPPKRQPVVEDFDGGGGDEATPADNEEKEVEVSEDMADLPMQTGNSSFDDDAGSSIVIDDLPDNEEEVY